MFFPYLDNGGVIRGKSTRVSSLEGRLDVDRGDGPRSTSSYLAVRRGDWELFSQSDTEFELRNHFNKY